MIAIAPMRADDVPAVAALLGILFAQERDFEPDERRQRRALERLLDAPEIGVVLVATESGTVVGSVTLLRTISTALGAEVCWLEDVIVAPGARGAGVGKRLLAEAGVLARERGWARISLLTDADNLAAQRLYARTGFARSDMVVMRRHLDD